MVTSQVARWFAPVMRVVVALYGLVVAVVEGVAELGDAPGDAVTVTTRVDGAGVAVPSVLEHEATLMASSAATVKQPDARTTLMHQVCALFARCGAG